MTSSVILVCMYTAHSRSTHNQYFFDCVFLIRNFHILIMFYLCSIWQIILQIDEFLMNHFQKRRQGFPQSIVSIDFDDYITIDPSWICPTTTTTTNTKDLNLSNRNFSTYYVLDNGCLRVHSYSLNSHILSNRLCITNPINENSLSYDTRIYSIYTLDSNTMMSICPPKWIDINHHCYRISDAHTTIQEARNSCITLP
ncbi:unnamed protein product, partial [Rotaria sordida]